MIRSPYGWAGLVVGFALVLLYATVESVPTRPPTGGEHDAQGAERACMRAVRRRVGAARFPFTAHAASAGEARYRLRGTVDVVQPGETVRRNYACTVRYAEAGTYHVDSLRVWQSH